MHTCAHFVTKLCIVGYVRGALGDLCNRSIPQAIITDLISICKHIEAKNSFKHFADIFKFIFMYQNCCIFIQMTLKFVPQGSIDSKPALVQVMSWSWEGSLPLSELMLALLTDAYMHYLASNELTLLLRATEFSMHSITCDAIWYSQNLKQSCW